MSPTLTVCATPGCPTLTPGNYCLRHANMTETEERTEIATLALRRTRYDETTRLDEDHR
ncbi:MAG: hypothetical protein QOK34_1602 [Gaiellaceae bacterium]|jgi:hypothetical protein|nr:hypothetical protein [Gaiellaceae bacterium]